MEALSNIKTISKDQLCEIIEESSLSQSNIAGYIIHLINHPTEGKALSIDSGMHETLLIPVS